MLTRNNVAPNLPPSQPFGKTLGPEPGFRSGLELLFRILILNTLTVFNTTSHHPRGKPTGKTPNHNGKFEPAGIAQGPPQQYSCMCLMSRTIAANQLNSSAAPSHGALELCIGNQPILSSPNHCLKRAMSFSAYCVMMDDFIAGHVRWQPWCRFQSNATRESTMATACYTSSGTLWDNLRYTLYPFRPNPLQSKSALLLDKPLASRGNSLNHGDLWSVPSAFSTFVKDMNQAWPMDFIPLDDDTLKTPGSELTRKFLECTECTSSDYLAHCLPTSKLRGEDVP